MSTVCRHFAALSVIFMVNPSPSLVAMLLLGMAAAILCGALIVALLPTLRRYALARPNARSSHTLPTAQGGGIAVILSTLACVTIANSYFGLPFTLPLLALTIATLALALLGAVDDIRPLPTMPRLLAQAIAIAFVLFALPASLRITPDLPLWLERAFVLIGGLWFINLVNFMDGLDWMTVAEILPVTITLATFGLWGKLPADTSIVAAALAGAMVGFAPFNKPVARLFLGDVGSLPIGLLTGWCLLTLGQHYLTAAILLPLYYLADATLTLLRRVRNGEAFWLAHRSHFYQRATSNGFTVRQVVGEVFVLNLFLAALAALSIANAASAVNALALICGIGAVTLVLWRFSRTRMATQSGR